MEIVEISPNDRDWWNSFVAESGGASILQSYEWGEIKQKTGWEVKRLGIRDNWKLVAGVSLLKRDFSRLPFSLLYAPRGPLFSTQSPSEMEICLQILSQAINDAYEGQWVAGLKIDPELPSNDPAMTELLSRFGFQRGRKEIQPRITTIIDLEPPLEQILASFEEKTRYNIRLAHKKGVRVRDDTSLAGVHRFYQMYMETGHRDRFNIRPLGYYETVFGSLSPGGQLKIFTAFWEGNPIASIWVFSFGKRAWYMYGASSNQERNRMPNHALQWHAIEWAKEEGKSSYDLWGIPLTPDPEHPLYGVYRFKKGFNGEQKEWMGMHQKAFQPIFYALEEGIQWYSRFRNLITRGRFADSLQE